MQYISLPMQDKSKSRHNLRLVSDRFPTTAVLSNASPNQIYVLMSSISTLSSFFSFSKASITLFESTL